MSEGIEVFDEDTVFDDNYDFDDEEDESQEELFRENPLKAIWIKLKEIEDKL